MEDIFFEEGHRNRNKQKHQHHNIYHSTCSTVNDLAPCPMLCQKSLLTTVNLKTILQIQSHRLLATTIVPIQYRSVVRNGDTCKSMSFSTTRDKPSPDGTSASSMMGWPSIILYGDLNMRPFRNVWMLEEIGLPYRHIPCRPWSRLSKSVHPLGKVPSLVVEYQSCDSGANEDTFTGSSNDAGNKIVVLESAAINTFLGDLAREKVNNHQHEGRNANIPVLVPPPATLERAKYDSLAFFIMTEIDSQSLWIHRKHSDLSEIFGAAPTAVMEAKQ